MTTFVSSVIDSQPIIYQSHLSISSIYLFNVMDQKAILAQLCAQAPSNEIRNVLREYKHDLSFLDMKKRFEKQRIDPLRDTLAYLKPPYLRPNLADYTKEGIIKNLICRVENFLPDTCLTCNQQYTVKLDDPTLLPCEKCGQEAHIDCLREMLGNTDEELTQASVKALVNPYNLPGWSYSCMHCKKEMIPSPNSDVKASVLKKDQPQGAQSNATSSVSTTNAADIAQEEIAEAPIPTENQEIDGAEGTHDAVIVENNPEDQHNQYPPSHPKSFQNICEDHAKGRCNKNSCEKNHPRICKKLLDNGNTAPNGCDGKTCRNLHPTICRNSLNKNKCLFRSCKYFHLKGTIRSSNEEKKNNVQVKQTTTSQKNSSANKEGNGDFLDQVRLMKSEILEAMDIRLATLRSEMVPQLPLSQEARTATQQQQPPSHSSQQQPYQMYPWQRPIPIIQPMGPLHNPYYMQHQMIHPQTQLMAPPFQWPHPYLGGLHM